MPHFPQETDTGCLPACAQMVLAHLLGTPYSHISRLHSNQIAVEYSKASDLNELAQWLNNDLLVIVFVQMGELPYARDRRAQHAVVVVGIDQDAIYVLDPAASSPVISVPYDDFLLGRDEPGLRRHCQTLKPRL